MASQIRPHTVQKLSFYRISCVPFKLLEQWLLALAPELIVDLQLLDQQAAFIVDKCCTHHGCKSHCKKAQKAARGHPDPCYCTVATDTLWHQGLGLCINIWMSEVHHQHHWQLSNHSFILKQVTRLLIMCSWVMKSHKALYWPLHVDGIQTVHRWPSRQNMKTV